MFFVGIQGDFEKKMAEKLINIILKLLEHAKNHLKMEYPWRGSLLDGLKNISQTSKVEEKMRRHSKNVRDLLMGIMPPPSSSASKKSSFRKNSAKAKRTETAKYTYQAPTNAAIQTQNLDEGAFDAFDPAQDDLSMGMAPKTGGMGMGDATLYKCVRDVLLPAAAYPRVNWRATIFGLQNEKKKEMETKFGVLLSIEGKGSGVTPVDDVVLLSSFFETPHFSRICVPNSTQRKL